MLQKLRLSGIDMSMSIAAQNSRYNAPRRYSSDTRPPSRPSSSTDGSNSRRRYPDRLENGDKRRVSFSGPTTASMHVYDVEDEYLENEQFLSETDQFINQTEDYDSPNVNTVDSTKKEVCRLRTGRRSRFLGVPARG